LIEIVQFLLQLHGAQPLAETDTLSNPSTPPPAVVNAPNKAGNTALHWAALNGHVEVILILLAHGADPSILNATGHDALYEAEVNEKEKAVEVLLREGGQLEGVVGGHENGEEDDDEEEEEEEDDREEDGKESGPDETGAKEDMDVMTDRVEKLDTAS
jgi:hypothetical protein